MSSSFEIEPRLCDEWKETLVVAGDGWTRLTTATMTLLVLSVLLSCECHDLMIATFLWATNCHVFTCKALMERE